MPSPIMSAANMKRHINSFWNPAHSQVSTSNSLIQPPPPLLPTSPLAAPANILVSLLLQLMKATVLAESSEYIHFHCDLSAPAMSTDMSQVGVALFPSFKNIFNHK